MDKCFGLLGNESKIEEEFEDGEIIETNEQLPNHETLLNHYQKELDCKKLLKNDLNCSICNLFPHKYTCPRCEIKTCSLKCSTQHKKTMPCSGVRDHTKFVPLKYYSQINFNSGKLNFINLH